MGIVIFGTGKACTWCVACCDYLEREGKGYTYKNVREDEGALAELRKWGFSSVPQVFIDGVHIGGYTALLEVEL